MNIAQALGAAATLGVARLDAQLLLLHVLGRRPEERAWLLAHDGDEFDESREAAFLMLCERRATNEPVAYLTGEKEFHGLVLHVDRRVLVPRPETETLVDWALEVLGFLRFAHSPPAYGSAPACESPLARESDRRLAVTEGNPSVLDLGTGSGAVALAIKHRCPHARVEATDASEGALAVARANAGRLSLDVDFRRADWLSGSRGPYDLIVSNPPYIRADDEHLAALRHEPQGALAAGPDGLDDIRKIVSQAPDCLRPGGWLLLEHGWDQAQAVRELLAAAGLQDVQSRRDLAGIERCSGGRLP